MNSFKTWPSRFTPPSEYMLSSIKKPWWYTRFCTSTSLNRVTSVHFKPSMSNKTRSLFSYLVFLTRLLPVLWPPKMTSCWEGWCQKAMCPNLPNKAELVCYSSVFAKLSYLKLKQFESAENTAILQLYLLPVYPPTYTTSLPSVLTIFPFLPVNKITLESSIFCRL